MDVELRHLLLVVEHGTFTAAARRAHLSQPALSASIRRLESAFGARLLHRGRDGAALSAEGQALVPYARAVLASIDDGRRAVREVTGLERGEVRLVASPTVTTYLLPPLLAIYRRRHPGVRIVLRELDPDGVHGAVSKGEVDLGVVGASGDGEPFESHGVVVEAWRRDEFVLVGARGAKGANAPFVTFGPGTATRAALDVSFPGVQVVMELGSIAAVKRHVRERIGIALVSRAAVEQDLDAGRLVLIRDARTPIRRMLWLVHRGAERLSPAASAVRELLLASKR